MYHKFKKENGFEVFVFENVFVKQWRFRSIVLAPSSDQTGAFMSRV